MRFISTRQDRQLTGAVIEPVDDKKSKLTIDKMYDFFEIIAGIWFVGIWSTGLITMVLWEPILGPIFGVVLIGFLILGDLRYGKTKKDGKESL